MLTSSHTTDAKMNRHSLDYHTRLHEWHHQRNILQQQQQQHHGSILQQQHQHHQDDSNTPLLPLANDTGHLTIDKFYSIKDWCLEVNKTFFTVQKKKNVAKSFPKHRQKNNFSSDKSVFKSARVKPVVSSGTFEVREKRGQHFKSLTKAAENVIPETSIALGTNDVPVNMNSVQRSSKKPDMDDHLDLCVRNSARITITDENVARVRYNFLSARGKSVPHKQNGKRPAEKFKNSPAFNTLLRGDNLYGYYGFISAVVRNVADSNDNTRYRTQEISYGTKTPTELSHIEDKLAQDEMRAATSYNWGTTTKHQTNSQSHQTIPAIDEIRLGVNSSFSSVQDAICSDDYGISAASVSCGNLNQSGNSQNGRNIDLTSTESVSLEHKQGNQLNMNLAKDNIANKPAGLMETESIAAMSVNNTINNNTNDASIKQGHTTQDRSYSDVRSHSTTSHNNKTSTGSHESSPESAHTSPQIKHNSSDRRKQNNGNTHVTSTPTERVLDLDNKEGSVRFRHEKLPLGVSYVGSPRGEGDNTSTQTEASIQTEIANVGLSNYLLNMLTIDDCKIWHRYSLVKTNKPRKDSPAAHSGIPPQLKMTGIKSRALTSNKPPVPHATLTIKETPTVDRKRPAMSEVNGKARMNPIPATTLEAAFRVLMGDKATREARLHDKSCTGNKVQAGTATQEGSLFYRRLNAALRKHMEEVRPTNGVTLCDSLR